MLWKYFDIPDYVYNANIYNVDIYNTLKSLVRNEKESFTLYGKIVQEQRYKNFFSKDGHSYSYSGMECKALGWPKIIDNLANIAQKMVQSEFNSALVNYYPDGKNYLSAHNDKDAMSSIIASFSFGAERTFRIRDIKTKKIVQDIELKNGSLLIMLSGMQQKYLHEVPKRLKVTDGRINVTLRQQY